MLYSLLCKLVCSASELDNGKSCVPSSILRNLALSLCFPRPNKDPILVN